MFTRSLGLILCLFFIAGKGLGQLNYYPDSLKKSVAHSKNDREKIGTLLNLAAYYGSHDDSLSQLYANQALEVAELSRDRKLIVFTYIRTGYRYLGQGELAGSLVLAIENFEQAEKIAKENGLDAGLVDSYNGLSAAFVAKGENEKALNYNNLALSIAANLANDSAKVFAYSYMGDTYGAKNEKLLAFRNYLEALNIAELSKNDYLILRSCRSLSGFYATIGEYDKAIDYEMRVLDLRRKLADNVSLLGDYNELGGLFTKKKQYDLALKMYERSILLADSMHFDLYKLNSYINIIGMYLSDEQYARGITYINEHKELVDFLDKAGLRFFTDESYGSAYTEMKRFDSAYFYFKRTEPDIEKKGSLFMKEDFYEKFGDYYRKKGDNGIAIAYYLKARAIGERVQNLDILQKSTAVLDSLYSLTGDYRNAYVYNTQYNKYTDSIKSLSKEADLLKLEVESDNRRRERLAREEEESTQHRHNVQYMGFTVGWVGLFVALVMMGFFVVSSRTIRALGFFSFIFLFEFIILLADKQIHEATHGEPWKVLLIKVGLAAILLPLHHWLEHKVMHYLTSRTKISPAGAPFFRRSSGKEERAVNPSEAAK